MILMILMIIAITWSSIDYFSPEYPWQPHYASINNIVFKSIIN